MRPRPYQTPAKPPYLTVGADDPSILENLRCGTKGMRRIIAVEPGEWVILPCILETDDCYYQVDVYPDGRVEASDDFRFEKTDFYGSDYRHFATIYNAKNDYMLFLKCPVKLTEQGIVATDGVRRLSIMASKW